MRTLAAMADTTTPTTSLPLAPGRWALDPFHSRVGFAIRHLGIARIRGHFGQFDAELVVGPAPETTAVTATVALASIDTGNADRDAHLRAPDLLDVERRPELAFRSTRVHGAGDRWTMEGDVTVAGITRPVTFAVELGGLGDFQGERHAGFAAHGAIRRDELGLDLGGFPDAVLGNVVQIELDLQFVEPS